MQLNTLEQIKSFIQHVAEISNSMSVSISVEIDSAIYGGVRFEVQPVESSDLSPPFNVTSEGRPT